MDRIQREVPVRSHLDRLHRWRPLWLVLLCALVGMLGFAQPARAQGSVTYFGITLAYSGPEPASQVITKSPGTININAPSGTVSLSGTANESDGRLDHIIVAATNQATIQLDGLTIDNFQNGTLLYRYHLIVLNGNTTVDVVGDNHIYANNTMSAIWSPASVTIKSSTGSGKLDLYEDDAATSNSAISVIAKDLTIGEPGSNLDISIDGLLMGGTLVSAGVTREDGTLTINGGTLEAKTPPTSRRPSRAARSPSTEAT